MKTVFKEVLENKKALVLLINNFIFGVVHYLLDAWILLMIPSALTNHDMNKIFHIGILLIISLLINGANAWTLPSFKHCFYTGLINKFKDKMLDCDVELFTKYSCSKIVTVREYLQDVVNAASDTVYLAKSIISMIISIVSMNIIAGYFGIIIAVLYGVCAVLIRILFKKYELISKETKEMIKDRNQEVENIINGYADVRSCNTVDYHRISLITKNSKIFKLRMKRSTINAEISMAIDAGDGIATVAILLYSLKRVANGLMTVGESMTLISFVMKIINPLTYCLDYIDMLAEYLPAVEDYKNIMSFANRNHDGYITIDKLTESIEFNNVSFSYEGDRNAINNINLSFPIGKKIGICGESGGGKSTIFKLLNRFYTPSEGTITADGFDINELTYDCWRKKVGVVHQESSIFSGTILENILYGNFDADSGDVIEACKKANLYDFIVSLPDGFDTLVGPRGIKLSGGQRQRIALARLFLSDPEIILLDEATSALDNECETLVQDAIDQLQDKTVITIAHRLSTIKNSDIIYVIDNDGVIEQGTHDELIANHGKYFALQK